MRRNLLYAAGWFAAVVVATSIGLAAVSLVGEDVGAPDGGVPVAVLAPSSPTPSPTETLVGRPTPTPHVTSSVPVIESPAVRPSQISAVATQVTDAGTVTARCVDELPRLVSWAPKTGWSVVAVILKPTDVRAVIFGDATGSNDDVDISVVCGEAAGPVFTVTTAPPPASPTPTTSDTPTPTTSSSSSPQPT